MSEYELSILLPKIWTSPEDLVSFIVAMLKNELLPAPLGPNSPNISPGLIVRLTSDNAVKLTPNELVYVFVNLLILMLLLFKLDS